MSRNAKYTDQDLDDRIASFRAREGRLPTYSEVKRMCPLGISNDRISSARGRVSGEINDARACPEKHEQATPLESLNDLAAGIATAVQEVYALHKKELRDLQLEIKKLRAERDRILAEREADVAKAAADARREVKEVVGAAMHSALAAQIDGILASATTRT